ncbi:YibE/F family protein [Oceanidesulfovibrio marinus]|uniref:YibE/F family protein n=1 Tax=Oceanidesulfovibrio marinus TaxID=370038 RepID=A0ABX6ND47_9BACT|nr:YibE/F family protein [Oceanidesulfovibrio marinus]QJT08522.1 YibE/F family protein [Oceanidesulfovibrio marinus]
MSRPLFLQPSHEPCENTTVRHTRYDTILVIVFTILSAILYCIPTGFEGAQPTNAVRVRGKIVQVNNDDVQQLGMLKKGHQEVVVQILEGQHKGETHSSTNQLLGRLDLDKIYTVGDTALVVLTEDQNGAIIFVNAQDHYRLGLELLLLGLFAVLLIAFAGWTGLKALLSFVFAALLLWKGLVPCMLNGYDPIWLSLGVIALLTAVVIFLVAGVTRKGVAAFAGAFLGVLTSCLMAWYFTYKFHVHGAVMPFAETLLYSGFGHLDLAKIYIAAVFIAASGAVMDLAMDVAASMHEVVEKKPDISRYEALKSGIRVGRAVVGTMTTTLLLAYSGGFITLLMAFMAQGIPLANMFNLIYVAAEVLKTIVGSFGLVTVAPFTAVVGAFLFVRK